MESNDNPEIPDKGETSDIPGLPSGAPLWGEKKKKILWRKISTKKDHFNKLA